MIPFTIIDIIATTKLSFINNVQEKPLKALRNCFFLCTIATERNLRKIFVHFIYKRPPSL